MHILGEVANEALVGLKFSVHLLNGADLHGDADAVKRVPRALFCNAYGSRQFIRAYAILTFAMAQIATNHLSGGSALFSKIVPTWLEN